MLHSSKPVIPPILGLFLAIFAVSTSSIFIRLAQTDAPSLAIAAWRLCIASLILIPIAWRRNQVEIRYFPRKTLVLLVISGVFLCFHFATWISSLAYTSVASSVVLVTTSPLWVAIASPLVLRERLPKFIWFGLAIAMAGSLIVAAGEACQIGSAGLRCDGFEDFLHGEAMWGNFLALVGAWCVAGYLLIGRWVRPNCSLLSYTVIVYGVAAIGLLILALLSGTRMAGFAPQTYLWFLLLAVVPQLIGHSTYNWALRYLPAAFVSIAALGEPICSSLLAMAFLYESPTTFEIVGGVLTLAGIYLAIKARSTLEA